MPVPLEVLAVVVLLLRGGEVLAVGPVAVEALLPRGLLLINVVVQSVDSSLNMMDWTNKSKQEESLENVLFGSN